MKAEHILDRSKATLQQRGIDNGYDSGEERSAAKVAAVFNAITGRDLTEHDAWLMMICLKLVRNESKPGGDSALDLVGYSALMAECDSRGVGHDKIESYLAPVESGPRSVAAMDFDEAISRSCRPGGIIYSAIRKAS